MEHGEAGEKKRSSLLSLTRRNVAIQSWIRDQEANRQANKAYRAAAQANDVAHQRRVALAEAQQDEFERWATQPGLSMKSKTHQEASLTSF
ncbi:hypothetical protein DYB37_008669 [Aphanomyces astaci]|uniref:Uncharacterized protein n=1 Tax=Aphanomyces astaci TaxID=112090 RepID=A0A418DFH0_APHAT|nr:hypothetical protein DYB35_003491 [Aphanomyces astaci]RHZ33491.1 hypothetical protein DYB37_008669 [Aphanomyces astaci]